jgi:protein involved in sex pheromone biosynthesis
MKLILAISTLVFALSFCNLSERLANKANQNSNNKNSSTASATPAKTSLKDSFPQTVGDFKLDNTYDKSEVGNDADKYLPGATDVLGAVYKSGSKKEQVMVGQYPSEAEAEKARDKKISSSSYPLRWTKGSLLFAARNQIFKDEL